jgi:hypothetical protein
MWIGVTALLPVYIYLNQLPSNTNLGVITVKIATDLPIGYIAIYPPKAIYYSPLGLMPKLDRTFCYIYNLFLPKPCLGLFINTAILKAYSTLTYSTVDEILALILFVKREAVILKCDLKDTFQNIPVAITD